MTRVIEFEIGCCGECPYYSIKSTNASVAQLTRASWENIFTGTALCPGMSFPKTRI